MMGKSLRVKFVFVMLLLILLLMTVVCVFLVQGVQRFFTDEFFRQMEAVFSDAEMYSALKGALDDPEPVKKLQEVMDAHKGQLGIDTGRRNYAILDGATGAFLAGSDPGSQRVEITPNILKALEGSKVFRGEASLKYMDVAVPLLDGGGNVKYVVYVRDNKQTVYDLNREIVTLIIEAVVIGFAVSVALGFILSAMLLHPIAGMTKAAEAMAGGDFSRKIEVESDDEVGVLARTFNNMADQLKATLEEIRRSEALRREFVANVSHELRTPLTSIRSYAETLVDYEDIPAEMKMDFLRVILNESERMGKIVQDLLVLSSFDAGSAKLSIERFALEKSIRDVCDAMALEIQKRGHELEVDLGGDVPEIEGDRARIEQVLLNVLSNAVKYTPDGGKIEIAAGREGGRAWVRISDNGIGIPQEDLTRIFDRFYRVDKARSRESGGTGLGLSIAREIVLRHGGDIKIESAVSKGTSVTILLPIEGAGREQP